MPVRARGLDGSKLRSHRALRARSWAAPPFMPEPRSGLPFPLLRFAMEELSDQAAQSAHLCLSYSLSLFLPQSQVPLFSLTPDMPLSDTRLNLGAFFSITTVSASMLAVPASTCRSSPAPGENLFCRMPPTYYLVSYHTPYTRRCPECNFTIIAIEVC